MSVQKLVRITCLAAVVVLVLSGCGDDKPAQLVSGLDKVKKKKIFLPAPAMANTSQEAVNLQHKFVAGQVTQGAQTMYVVSSEQVSNSNPKYSTRYSKIDFQYKVEKLNKDGSANIEIRIKRVQLKDEGKSNQEFDSQNKKSKSTPLFILYDKLIDTPIRFTVAANGKTTGVDVSAVRNKLTSITNAKIKNYLIKIAKDIAHEGFIQFPDKPVKPGDKFSPGAQKAKIANLGILNTQSEYVVKSISSDKSKALLERRLNYKFIANKHNPIKTELRKSEAVSWVLFDLAKGKVIKGASEVRWALLAKIAKAQLQVSTNTQTYYEKKEATTKADKQAASK